MEAIKMCVRTVEGDEETQRTVDGSEFFDRSVSGLEAGDRNVSGVISTGVLFLGSIPTFTQITTPGSGTYTAPPGCIYIDVYLIGAGGGGAGGRNNANRTTGGGGGGGGIAFGQFLAGSYSYTLQAGGLGGAGETDGSASVGTSSFENMTATSGGGGRTGLLNDATIYPAAANGTSTNSLLQFGFHMALPTGRNGGNGGGNRFASRPGAGSWASASFGQDGFNGLYGGGGGGGQTSGNSGGDGGAAMLIVIAYF